MSADDIQDDHIKTVSIDLGRQSYSILIGEKLIENALMHLPDHLKPVKGRKYFIVSDENVAPLAQVLETSLQGESPDNAPQIFSYSLPAGEATKSFARYEALCNWMLSHRVGRNSVVFALGGGVIGDLTGFAASSVLRGISYVQVPTTLLSQVDSSVGGKTGINSTYGKNLIGAFYQPDLVLADLQALETLPKRELLAGYAEVVKYGLIADEEFFCWLEEHGQEVVALKKEALSYAIEKSVQAKAAIVAEDEKEKGRRALLNLGHTFGHALEAWYGYDGRLLHGEAVALGTIMAFDTSRRMGFCGADDLSRVVAHFRAVGLPVHLADMMGAGDLPEADKIIDLMGQDKKVVNGTLNFILNKKIGESFVCNAVQYDILKDVLTKALSSESAYAG